MGIIDINYLIATAQKAKAETEFETKVSMFMSFVNTMWDEYSSDLRKLMLYGVNVLQVPLTTIILSSTETLSVLKITLKSYYSYWKHYRIFITQTKLAMIHYL